MKKLLKSALLSAAFAGSVGSLQALPVGNPSDPSLLIDGTIWEGAAGDPCDPCATWCDAISLRAGFYGDYVFDRILKVDAPKTFSMGAKPTGSAAANYTTAVDRPNPAYNKHLHDAEWFTNAGFIALNIWDRFDVFCTLGASNGYIRGNSTAFNLVGLFGVKGTTVNANELPNVSLSNGVVELYTDTSFSWSVGARGALWECGCATLGAEFQYAQSKPKVEELNVICNVSQFSVNKPKGYKGVAFPLPTDAGVATATGTKSATINYHEWQVGASLSYRLNSLVPYIGVQWSRATFDADNIRIAQPKLPTAVLNLTAWNPSLLGNATALSTTDSFSDFMQIVSCQINKFKSRKACGVTVGATLVDADKLSTTDSFSDFMQIVSCQINKFKSRKACGVTVGATLVDADKWSLTAEARLINERAAHVSGQFRF